MQAENATADGEFVDPSASNEAPEPSDDGPRVQAAASRTMTAATMTAAASMPCRRRRWRMAMSFMKNASRRVGQARHRAACQAPAFAIFGPELRGVRELRVD